MRIPALAFALALASCAAAPSAQRPPRNPTPASKMNFYLGVRTLDEDDWEPVEDQGALGIEFVHEPPDSAVGFELGLFISGDEEEGVLIPGPVFVDVEGETGEVSVGVRKTFEVDEGPVRPYIGGGVSAIRAEFDGDVLSDDDTSGGLYVHAGVDFEIGPAFLLGFDLRYLGATDIDLFGVDGSANYFQFAMFFGFRF